MNNNYIMNNKYNIINIASYKQIIIIDEKSYINDISKTLTVNERLIEILLHLNLITIKNNKLKWIGVNTCIVYNLHTQDNNIISKIKTFFNYLKIIDSEIIYLYKHTNSIYVIGNNIVLHSNIIKDILKNSMSDILITDINQIYEITNELIRISVLNMININKIDINESITNYINKNSYHTKKINSVNYLDKTCLINNYKENKGKIYCIGEKNKGIFRIINDNQIILM